MSSIFARIVRGDIPCYKIAESEDFLAFLDINPLVKGHTLVVPKVEVDYIFDLSEEQLSGLHLFSKKVAKGMKKVLPCERIGVTVIGLEVPHAHIHLIPIFGIHDMDFSKAKLHFTEEEFILIADKIKAAI